jgi:ADP-heptose:LPS heptosyltransferase
MQSKVIMTRFIQYIFPYNRIPKDSRIIIYGAGAIGVDLIQAVVETQYCELVCVLDRQFTAPRKVLGIDCFGSEHVREIDPNSYDYILIVLYNGLENEVKARLLSLEIPESKLIVYNVIYNPATNIDEDSISLPDDGGDVLHIAVRTSSGLGDKLLMIQPLMEIKRMMPSCAKIDILSIDTSFWRRFEFMNNSRSLMDLLDTETYDAVLYLSNFTYVEALKPRKIRRLAPEFADYIDRVIVFMRTSFPSRSHAFGYALSQYHWQNGIHRKMANDKAGTFTFKQDDPAPFPIEASAQSILERYALVPEQYITLLVDSRKFSNARTKVYPIEHCEKLIKLFKQSYPNLKIVLVGSATRNETLRGEFVDLCGKTNLDEIAVVLKNSLIFISSEGGLVHLNHAVGGVSCCLFGPTLPEVYGYARNINIRSAGACRGGCEWLYIDGNKGWYCQYDEPYPPCMRAIKPEYVFERIVETMGER